MKQPNMIQELLNSFYDFVNANIVMTSGLMAVLMAFVRTSFTKSEGTFVHHLSDALICGFLTLGATPLLGYLGLEVNFSIFLGSMIGFIGAEKIRSMLFDFVGTKIGVNKNER